MSDLNKMAPQDRLIVETLSRKREIPKMKQPETREQLVNRLLSELEMFCREGEISNRAREAQVRLYEAMLAENLELRELIEQAAEINTELSLNVSRSSGSEMNWGRGML